MLYPAIDYLARELPRLNPAFRHNPAQTGYAESIVDALNQGKGRIHCLEADTGVGKTLAYLLVLAEWIAGSPARRRVAISTFSRALQRQIVAQENQDIVNGYLAARGLKRLRFAVRMGRSNYVSHERLKLALGVDSLEEAAIDEALDERARGLAHWALSTEGCLLDLDEEDFPDDITAQDICLASGEAIPPRLKEYFDDAAEADILIINHALLTTHLIERSLVIAPGRGEQVVLLDEAEHFPDAAAGILSHTLSVSRVARLALEAGYARTFARWAALRDAETSDKRAGEAHNLSPQRAHDFLQALNSIRRTPQIKTPANAREMEWQRIRDTARELLRRLKDADPSVVVNYSPVRGLPSLLYLDASAGRCLQNRLDERITILTSATLSDMTENDWRPSYRYMLGRLLLSQDDDRVGLRRQHSAQDFGRLRFIIGRAMPQPVVEEAEDGYQLTQSYARQAVRQVLDDATGRVLVLCPSYTDVQVLSKVWPDRARPRLVTHPRGAQINVIAQELDEQAVLLTPAGWEGLSPQRNGCAFWSRVVILRTPSPPPDAAEQLLLVNRLRATGCDEAVARSRARTILFARNRVQTLHKLRQGLGRAIRHPEDRAEVLLLDPRFPRSSGTTTSGLACAIPQRFRLAYAGACREYFNEQDIVEL